MHRTFGYLASLPGEEDIPLQKESIQEYLARSGLAVRDIIWLQQNGDGNATRARRKASELTDTLESGDILLTADLSCLGRSVSEVVVFVSILVRHGIRLISIRQDLDFWDESETPGQILIKAYSQLADLEREIISARTVRGLQKAVEMNGKKLGRPRGRLGKSKLDGREEEIKVMLGRGMTISAIARLFSVSRPALINFIKTRIEPADMA